MKKQYILGITSRYGTNWIKRNIINIKALLTHYLKSYILSLQPTRTVSTTLNSHRGMIVLFKKALITSWRFRRRSPINSVFFQQIMIVRWNTVNIHIRYLDNWFFLLIDKETLSFPRNRGSSQNIHHQHTNEPHVYVLQNNNNHTSMYCSITTTTRLCIAE